MELSLKRFSLIAILTLLSATLFSQSYSWSFDQKTLTALVWTRNYEVTKKGFSDELTQKEKIAKIQEQAAFYFSGMINGFDFYFEPNSYRNGVKQKFRLTPLGTVDKSKITLDIIGLDDEHTEFLAHYATTKLEQSKRSLWQDSKYSSTYGRGESSLFEGYSARTSAINKAIKASIINLFKEKLANKPRIIEGRLILVEAPRVFLDKGHIFVDVKVLLEERDIEEYLH